MKKYSSLLFHFLIGLVFLSATSIKKFNDETSIQGTWIRKGDNLKIQIRSEKENQLISFIVENGTEKFPCEVSGLPIYKDIVKIKDNHWTCNFLVVTMGSCSTAYHEGEIRITKSNELEVICPGFSKKIYKKLKPRYEKSGSK